LQDQKECCNVFYVWLYLKEVSLSYEHPSIQKNILFNLGEEQNIILDSIADGVFTVDSDWR